ncbi:MAG: Rpn family recombination-promoting nuclease/putative transposase [Firmicutes bacterium]|uniref:Rpn family recombination-promoting nuclease/putative transposase n=1 Tax=Desulforamulus profundi TaxID=1383067 RepID=UPI001EE54B66|nr:Rpn family recombination-promoting nuclease/putative transposase [Desulforamulus profundi]MCL5781340.1 Rpn family recombination-promoting nuclease/putative transposase [Bacillota bacterium]
MELLNRELDPKYLLDKAARLDILARTAAGALVNVEVQIANKYNIDKRTLFYWAGLYHGQLNSGQDFIHLRKTITINILGFDWFKGKTKYQHTFRIREDETGELLNDELEIHFLELEKFIRLKRRPKDALEEWLLYFNNIAGEEMEAIAMGNPGIRKAMIIEQIFFKSQRERRLYELREKAARDEISMISGARAEGEAKGIEKGRAVAQEAICKYLDARFSESSYKLQAEVKRIADVTVLDKIINKIYTVNSLDEAAAIIREATQK